MDWNAHFARMSRPPAEQAARDALCPKWPEPGYFGGDEEVYGPFGGETTADYIADAIRAFDEAARALGLDIKPETANLALAQVMGESLFGRHGTLGGNDWGAFQGGMTKGGKPVWIGNFQAQYKNGPKGVGGLAHRDSQAGIGGQPGYDFVAYYRVYPSQYEAAKDWIRAMQRRLGFVGPNAPVTAEDYAARAFVTGYYGGFHSGARPLGQRSAPFNEAEQANIDDYARLLNNHAPTIARVRTSGKQGRDPHTVDFPSIKPIWERLSAGLVGRGASQAQMVAAARKAFPPGGSMGDYDALAKTNGLAWIVRPPPGYRVDGTKGRTWSTGAKIGIIGIGVAVGGALAIGHYAK